MSNEFVREPRLADGIGRALTEVREGAGIATAKELADMTGLTRPRISRVEGGRARPRPDEVEKWAQAAQLGEPETQQLLAMLADYDAWRADLDARIRYGIAGHEISYTDTFKASKEVRTFAAWEIPGYLQIPEYAQATVALASPDAPADERDEAVKARLERGGYLKDDKRDFTVVIAESALRWLLCDPDVMRSQIGHLYKFLHVRHVHLYVLPMGRRLSVAPLQSFTVHDDQFVMADLYGGSALLRQQEPQRYIAIMRELVASAVRGDAARDLLSATMAAVPAR